MAGTQASNSLPTGTPPAFSSLSITSNASLPNTQAHLPATFLSLPAEVHILFLEQLDWHDQHALSVALRHSIPNFDRLLAHGFVRQRRYYDRPRTVLGHIIADCLVMGSDGTMKLEGRPFWIPNVWGNYSLPEIPSVLTEGYFLYTVGGIGPDWRPLENIHLIKPIDPLRLPPECGATTTFDQELATKRYWRLPETSPILKDSFLYHSNTSMSLHRKLAVQITPVNGRPELFEIEYSGRSGIDGLLKYVAMEALRCRQTTTQPLRGNLVFKLTVPSCQDLRVVSFGLAAWKYQ